MSKPDLMGTTAAIKALLRPGRLVSLYPQPTPAEHLADEPRMGGRPYAEQGDHWPVCGGCHQEMAFVAQFKALAHLWVFHYCCVCNPWHSHEGQKKWSLRKYPQASAHRAVGLVSTGPVEGVLSASRWDEADALFAPGFEEARLLLPSLGESLPGDVFDSYGTLVREVGAADWEGTRVGGYADWVQEPSVPRCADDGDEMVLLAQIASDAGANLVFGDVGSVYLMVCPKHLDNVVMEMQCS